MIRFLSLFILCQLGSSWLWSQGSQISQTTGRIGSGNAVTFDDRYQGIRGTPYIFPEWLKGIVYPTNLDAIPIEFLNFDRQSLELCHKEAKDSKPLLINKYIISSFQVLQNSDTLTFIRVRVPLASDFGFMELVYQGEATLYLDYDKTFTKADYENVYSSDRRYDEYQDKPAYYLQFKEEEELQAIKKNKKQMASLFGSYSEQILEYIKEEKNSLKSRAELIALMQYYDSIKD